MYAQRYTWYSKTPCFYCPCGSISINEKNLKEHLRVCKTKSKHLAPTFQEVNRLLQASHKFQQIDSFRVIKYQ